MPTTARATSERAVFLTATRPAWRSGAIWGSLFGLLVAASAAGYVKTFPTEASRRTLAESFGSNAGIAALIGPARHLDTVAGFTAWRTLGIINILGGIWGLLLATRLTRGEEEAGRWELLLAGPVTRRGAAIQAAGALGVALATAWTCIASFALAAAASKDVKFPVTGTLFLATALIASALMFAAIALLVSQLVATRRLASAVTGGVLGAAYLLRMVADVTAGQRWLLWASPLGWAEELHPLTGSHWFPFVLIVLLAAAAVGGAAFLAGGRDLGASALPDRDAPPSRLGLLGGPVGLTLRLTRPLLIGWTLALATLGVVLGLVAQSASKVVTGSKTISDMLARIGGSRAGAAAYIGFAFLFAAALVAFAAAGQVSAFRTEEADGYLDNLVVRPVARTRWLAGRLAVAVGLVTVASLVVGVAAWAGAATQHTGIGFGELVGAGINTLPPALFVLGLGTVVYAVAPRRAPVVGYVIVTWSFVVELVASIVTSNRVLLGSSLLHYVTPAPAAPPDWRAAAVVAALGFVGMVAGLVGFGRRDLASA